MDSKPRTLKEYYQLVPKYRKKRIKIIRDKFLKSLDDVRETFKYKMPTFEKENNWVALANQKHYISVYFCSADLISDIKKNNPKINTGKGCVRIKDSDEIPIRDLTDAFIKAINMKK